MTSITVNAPSGKYDVLIDEGCLLSVGAVLKKQLPGRRVAVVTDDNVAPIYLDKVENSFRSAGFDTYTYILKHGEASKCGANFLDILEFLASSRLDRSDTVAALGGGVVGDIAGFAAAAYLRGIKYMQIPTTLLSMTDSSVGGKTAIDLKAGKNLAGAFWQPVSVVADTKCLETLPEAEIKNGLGEILKYAVIAGGEILELLEDGFSRHAARIIALSVDIKRGIVEADEKEAGPRRILNLGHTPAHAAEKLSGYTFPHGVQVAAGVNTMLRASHAKYGLVAADAERIERLTRRLGLPTRFDYSPEELAAAAANDKKTEGSSVNAVIVRAIGKVECVKIPVSELKELFI